MTAALRELREFEVCLSRVFYSSRSGKAPTGSALASSYSLTLFGSHWHGLWVDIDGSQVEIRHGQTLEYLLCSLLQFSTNYFSVD